ncbi:MAG TPA: Uma2 family endonuclease [Elainellaceae cyanobacterium]
MYQSDPPRPARETLPTMYDLPSEDPNEPGVPDEFHIYQPQLLRETFCPPAYPADQIFVASDLNLYYDVRHPHWYKRPDWFAVVGIDRFYEERDLRLSYVTWQEGVDPFVVVELLSPGTEADDLGRSLRRVDQPPSKWQVYEQILRIPYYVVFDRYTDRLRGFMLQADRYMELELDEPRIWMESLELGLGLWQGRYEGINRFWLRWYDKDQNWILTPVEQERQRAEQERQRADQGHRQVEQERQRAEQERQRADRLAERLRQMGIDPDAE